MAGILVGVDGSEHSHRALVWAMHEAAQHHVALTVMTVHQVPPRPVTEVYWNIPRLEEDVHDVDVVRATVQEFVDHLRSKVDAGFVRVYFQTLVPRNTEMLELLADTLKGRL